MRAILLSIFLALTACSIDEVPVSTEGQLALKVSSETLIELSTEDADDISKYEIYLYDADGGTISGFPTEYGDLDEAISLPVGSITVKAQSILDEEINLPTRDSESAWYYKGEESATITAGNTTSVHLTVAPAVAKLYIELAEDFVQNYPDYSFDISGIIFNAANMEPAYFQGGEKLSIQLSYTVGDSLVSRAYAMQDALPMGGVVTLKFDYDGNGTVESGNLGIDIDVDHSLSNDIFEWDIEDGSITELDTATTNNSFDNPFSVLEARSNQNGNSYWVEGYIVGHVQSSITVTADYTEAEDTNIAIAATKGETDISKMLFVELPGTASVARTALGLNATAGESLGYKLKLYGALNTYFSSPGLRGVNLEDEFAIIEE